MGNGQPYLYDPPARYSAGDPFNGGFNPKAVTLASYSTPPPSPPKKQEGPLLNFNRHPDSYLILPGRQDPVPMSAGTKSRVKWTRKIQQAFRVLQLLGAIGILACAIIIRGMTNTESVVLRATPAVDIVNAIYGTYHLWRPAHGRPPMSSSSYHGFAGIVDTGFIGLFVAIGFRSRFNYLEQPGTSGRWRTILPTDSASNELLMISYLGSFVLAGVHLISLTMDVWLCIIYRKIAKLPPDMNPLEDNLTARRQAKHKYKNSSVSDLLEKPTVNTPGSRTSDIGTKRRSHVNVRESLASEAGTQVSFFGSRADQDVGYSPHNPRTARWSQVNLSETTYKQPGSARQSRADLHQRESLLPDEPLNRRVSALPSEPSMSKRNSAMYSPSVPSHDIDSARTHSSKPSRESLQNDNWFVLGSSERGSDISSVTSYDPYKYSATAKEINASPRSKKPGHTTRNYEPVPSHSPSAEERFIPQPLGMNPPTPPPQPVAPRSPSKPLNTRDPRYYVDLQQEQQEEKENRPVSPLHPSDTIPSGTDRTGTMQSAVSALTEGSRYSRSSDAGETVLSATTAASQTVVSSVNAFNHAPKSRFSGDLNSALRGVRQVDRLSEGPRSMVGSIHGMSEVGSAVDGSARPMRSGRGWMPPESWKGSATKRESVESVSGTVVRKDAKGRVVSRSGVDEGDLGLSGMGTWKGRKRDVSGKVAEEGRGGIGGWRSGAYLRKISGNNGSGHMK